MLFNEYFFFSFLFFFLSLNFFFNISSSLNLLLVAEIIWITIFALSVFISFIFEDLSLLSLSFFSLIFSAAEFGLGLILSLCQNFIFKSTSLSDNSLFLKFSERVFSSLLTKNTNI